MSYFFRPLALLFLPAMLLAQPAAAQTTPPATPEQEKVYTYVEQMLQLPGGGGQAAIVTAIQQHVSYPPRAMQAHAEGRVFVGFTVAASGLVEDVSVVKGFRPDCDSTVVAAVQQLPRFRPGQQAGIAVPVRFTVPVTFRLREPLRAASISQEPANDSALVYTSVQFMPLYKGKEGTEELTKDFARELHAASAANNCTLPKHPLYIALTIGPSGVIYGVKNLGNAAVSVINLANNPDAKSIPSQLTAACEATLLVAASRLPRLKPGSLNGRRVAVGCTLVLKPPFK